ncbi:HNH endonuclease [Clostridium botulinum]|nr:HNH endonuclease [Clostridium botulinum]
MLGKNHNNKTKKTISTKNMGRKISEEIKKKISQTHKGKRYTDSEWGGHKKIRSDGYISVYMPEHPHANKEGYVMEHRLVMEKVLGRYIRKNEVVHHINKKRNDNRPENLMIFSSINDHAKYHAYFKKGVMTYQ